MRKGLAILISLVLIFGGGLGSRLLPGAFAIDSPPEITGSDLVILQGDPLDVMAGIIATDDIDGDITHLVVYDAQPIDTNEVGLFYMFYYVEDSSSQYGELLRFAVVVPDSNPFIWPPEIYVELGDFDPLRYIQAFDLEDKDISASLEVLENTVDPDVPGVYDVTVKATDSDFNATTQTIRVVVEEGGTHQKEPEIQAETVIIKVGDPYDPLAGVTASDENDGDISHLVQVEWDEVDTDVPGMYWTYYSVENSLGEVGGNGRKVIVLADSNPMIFCSEQWEMGMGGDFEDFILHDAEAYDYEDGDISEFIEVESHNVDVDVAGEYELTLVVEDSDHNSAHITVKVLIIDYSYPRLDASGGTLFLGQDFNPLDYVSAWDEEDGDLTEHVEVVANGVNTQIEGSYEVTYRVTNSADKTTTKTVTFEVVRMPEFRIFIIFGGSSYEVEVNIFDGTMRFTSPVGIPAGSLVGMEIYMDGELMGSLEDVIMVDEILPNVTYLLSGENENELRAVAVADEGGENGEEKGETEYPADQEELPHTGLTD